MSDIVRRSKAWDSNTALPVLRAYDPATEVKRQMPNKPPYGFWYQVGTDWEDWCAGNMPEWLKDSRLLLDVDRSDFAILDSPDSMAEFAVRYSDNITSLRGFLGDLNWARIMSDYKGIEMPNYQHGWSLDFDSGANWTYGWDCASGVCWQPLDCITIIGLEPRVKPPQKSRILLND